MHEFKVGDVVEVGGMRGIIREEKNGIFRVSGGRADRGIWVNTIDMEFKYRDPEHDRAGYASRQPDAKAARADARKTSGGGEKPQ